jgi:hypothetical protein
VTSWIDAEVEKAQRRNARNLRYIGRLLPIDRLADVPGNNGDRAIETFTRWTFSFQANHLFAGGSSPPVLINHDKTRRIGHLTRLWPEGAWWHVEFQLDDSERGHFARTQLLNQVGNPAFRDPPLSAAYYAEQTMGCGALENARCVTIAELLEVSLCLAARPVYPDARVYRRREEIRPASSPPGGLETAAALAPVTAGAPRVLIRDSGVILEIR